MLIISIYRYEEGFEKADESLHQVGMDYLWLFLDPEQRWQKHRNGLRIWENGVEHSEDHLPEDITRHVLPTLKFANMYVTRIVNPILFYLRVNF